MSTDTPLRFCLVSTFYPPFNFGGDGIYAHRLANGLAARGHEVTVLHSPDAYRMLAGGDPEAGYEDHPRVSVRPVPTPGGQLGLLVVQQTGRPGPQAPALKRLLDRGEFDVVHYNNVSLLGGPHVFRYGRGLKLCTLIEHWLVCPMHVLWKLDEAVCDRPTCLRCVLHGGRPPQVWRYTGLMDRATRSIDAFIGPSLFTIRKHQERGIKGTMVQLPLFQTDDGGAPRSEPGTLPAEGAAEAAGGYFLFVGRLEKIKGVQEVIPLFRRQPGVELRIAGSGTFEPELRSLADGAANIRFLGNVDQTALRDLYRNAVATLVPSLCYETFGVVVAESFAARTPVIAYAQSSPEEMIRAHGGGLLYRTHDELADAVERLRTDPALRERLAGEGRSAFEREFAEEPFMRNYLAVVEELRARKAAGASGAALAAGESLAGRPVFHAS